MSDAAYMDFDPPPAGGWIDRDVAHGGKPPADETEKSDYPPVLRLPDREPPLRTTEVRHGITQRAKSCANMRLEGFSFLEIAETLEYSDAREAKRDFKRAMAASHSPEEWETMRQVESMRAERLFRQSFEMAQAEYLVDEEGQKVPNADRLRWHQQAAADLMNHATISGAKAPTKLEVTPGEAQFEELVSKMLERSGHKVAEEADVLELTQLSNDSGDEEVDLYGEEG